MTADVIQLGPLGPKPDCRDCVWADWRRGGTFCLLVDELIHTEAITALTCSDFERDG